MLGSFKGHGYVMRKVVLIFSLLSCAYTPPYDDAESVAEEYLRAIESGDFKKAYLLIDGVSRRATSFEEFEKFWRDFFKRYGKPYKHTIIDVSRDGKYVVVEYSWSFQRLPENDTSIFLDSRGYRLRLVYEFRRWAIKFRKYTIIKETPTPYGIEREIIKE